MSDGGCRGVTVLYVRDFFFLYSKKKIRVGGKNRVGQVTPIKQFFGQIKKL